MAAGTIDVLMFVVGPKGPMAAESNTTFTVSTGEDTLREGFTAGFFCELQEFNFAAGVASALDEKPKMSLEDQKAEEDRKKRKKDDREAELRDKSAEDRRKWFAERQSSKQDKRSAKRLREEFVDMQPVEFTRVMDSMSTLLFQSLVNCDTLKKLSVVKRKATGANQSGGCYLRLDFENVLLTDLQWKDSDHLIMETGTFIYRKLTIRYRPQLPDGKLGAVVPAEWEMEAVRSGA